MITIRDLAIQLLTMASAMLVFMAHQYDTIGHGLNPWIALPTASFLILLPHLIRGRT